MVEESSPQLPPVEESIEAVTDTALERKTESGELTPDVTSKPSFICDCEESMRSACTGLPFYKELESRRYCVLHFPGKEKSADFKVALERKLNSKDFDFQGVWFPDRVDFNDFEFSAAADFRYATFSATAGFSSARFSATADFRYATFSAQANFSYAAFSAHAYFLSAFRADANFKFATFSADVDFSHATFNADAGFMSATFSAHADFVDATFNADANFKFAMFSAKANFLSVTFSADANFEGATFSAQGNFKFATFSGDADFDSATFKSASTFEASVFHAHIRFTQASIYDSLRFFGCTTERQLINGARVPSKALGNDPSLDFQHARIQHPDRVAFHTLNLRPHWFVNVDPRQFVFTDVGWEWDRIRIKLEIAALEAKQAASANDSDKLQLNRLLAIACRHLAENAEANNRYEEASNFRYWSMDLARRTKWKGWSFWKTDWLHMLYWSSSGYGERILRAFAWLLGIWIVFALLYTNTYFKSENKSDAKPSTPPVSATRPEATQLNADATPDGVAGQAVSQPKPIVQRLPLTQALTYSLAIMTLQKPEPRPLRDAGQVLVLLETILGPVQAALLALAIRRKFMR